MKPGNPEDLEAQLKQLEEFEWPSPKKGSDFAGFLAIRTIAKPELIADIRWAKLVQRSPWVRPLRVFFFWGLLVGSAVVMLIAQMISAVAKYMLN